MSVLSVCIDTENKQFNRGQIVIKKLEIARWKKVLADATMLFNVETDLLDDEMFNFDIENDVEDLLLENLIYQDGDEENKNYGEDGDEENETHDWNSKEETADYQDYSDKD